MTSFSLRSLLLAAFVLSNCITWTTSRHHSHNVSRHRSRHRRQGEGLYLSSSYVLPGGEGSGWGEWGEMSPCSRTCGGGVASQTRICLQIGPDGQPQCTGGNTKYVTCQTQDCPAGSGDFRAEQCAAYNDIPFRGIKYNWVPYTKSSNPCDLKCMPRGERFYYRHKVKVVDGTRCSDDSFDVCVDGVCQPVGCDMRLGSDAREDKCLVCRGNGTNCHTIAGLIDSQDYTLGYADVLLIPEGATSILIEEVAASDNYLALRANERNNGTYYLNGNWQVNFPHSLMIAGALWSYERSQQGFAAPDILRCPGPTNEPLVLSLLLQEPNVGVEYEYSLPADRAPPLNKAYNWVHDDFTPCSAACGGGTQTRNVTCRSREELELVDESLCEAALRPPAEGACNTQPCAPQWVAAPWGRCSRRCGRGGSQSRDVSCQKIITNGYPSIVADKECFDLHGPKPNLYQECNGNATCPSWFTGPWKPCDKLCDEGKQTRQVVCYQKNGRRIEVLDDGECEDEKPADEQTCLLQLCEGVDWVVSDWSGCDSCLSTVRTRVAVCATKEQRVVNASLCAYHAPPATSEPCDRTALPACEVQWYATQWSKCSVTCGSGVQTRRVFCGLFDGASVLKVDDARCAGQPKYNDTKPCDIPKDKCPSQWFAGPWSACTKTCGGGQQFRRTMCLRGGEVATDCDADTVIDSTQECHTGPCNKDDLLPVDENSTPVMDEFEDCEDEDYPEVGLDAISLSTLDDMMFSDSSSTLEGSGMWSSTSPDYGLESEFTDSSSLSTDELLSTEGSGARSTSDIFITDEFSTDTSSTDLSSSTSGYGSTTEETTDGNTTESSSSTDETGTTITAETGSTDSSTTIADEATTTSSDTDSSSEEDIIQSNSSQEDDTADTETAISSTTEEGSTSPSESSATESTEPSGSTDATETSSSDTETTEVSSDATTASEDVSSTTESGSSTESSTTSESDSTTESDTASTESDSSTTESATDGSSTSESTTESGTTESSASDSTTESGTTESSDGTTETSEGTTESGTTESGTTETGTTETGTTETGTTETGSTETGSTETGSTDTEITSESDTEGSTTESGSTTAITEETTEVSATSESGSTESEATTETGSTESTATSDTDTTDSGPTTESTTSDFSSTVSSEGTESSTTEGSESTTPWDWSSTVESYSTKRARVCRPRSCAASEFGCCPDKKTPAHGPFDEGCPKPTTCKESKHGCCPDGVSAARGPRARGCPHEDCALTLFGCCASDNETAALGNDQEGCPPPPPPCQSSKYGCCKDGETEATGPKKKGCPETVTTSTTQAGTTTVASVADCTGSAFGCCSDNQTAAAGPDQQGCLCSATAFGCCPDGVTPAQDAELSSCPKSCNESSYGCCPDGASPAHGPDQQGCCLLYPYGCCPDNYKPADGPHLEGCGCQYSRFGCCPDNITIATGPNNKGCGCKYAEHGCCPDWHTEASGPEFEGCSCHTFQFGCCPDGSSTAQGPNGQGCHCLQSKFGCCGDQSTRAAGPGAAGCDCSNSKFGCCPDGVTDATGPKFLGCTDIPENKQASCSLKFERGPCRNYSVYWYFDNDYGGCSRFWYGGCDGNGNRFTTKEECEDTCVSPPAKDACKLPQSKGACFNNNVRWFYDTEREMCNIFSYGGCLGNKNNFETREACQAQCEPERTLDQCSLPIEQGSCAGNYPRWGFDKDAKRCRQFTWGGCEGNSNRFSTEAACVLRCDPPGKPKSMCSEEVDVGNCTDKYAAWAFRQSENRCVPFYYSGCGGNDNRFDNLDSCEGACPSAYVPDLCALPAETGECGNYREKWYYDTKDERCRQFYYGGCGGNHNNFATEAECERRCAAPPTTTTAPPAARPAPPAAPTPPQSRHTENEFCFLPLEAGPCSNASTRWGYDAARGRCVTYQYGGCGGNMNNFPDEEYCVYYCQKAQDICQLPMSAGSCDESHMMWFYDKASDSCSQFAYGGCDGNDNRFETREACETQCKTGPEPEPEGVPEGCGVSPALEACEAGRAGPVWYFSAERRACSPHDNPPAGAACRYSGAFASEEACERNCGAFRNINVCQYPLDPGSCQDFVMKYHFDPATGRCIEFAYGGCVGGPNRFSSVQECVDTCSPVTDPCKQPPEPGNCVQRYDLWYYNEASDSCDQFVYGGCGGNDNKFESREACEGRCKKEPAVTTTTTIAPAAVQEECATPPSLEACGPNITAFYYDAAAAACRAAPLGACGLAAAHASEEACERRCGRFRGLDVCAEPLNPGPCRAAIPKFYFDSASGACKEFIYGGCDGSGNRFSSEEECMETCEGAGPAAACLAPLQPGDGACGAAPARRWHYSAARGSCLVFAFAGCGANENNFLSYERCAELCHRPPAPAPGVSCGPSQCEEMKERCERVTVSAGEDGCERCECECDERQRLCDALRCEFGVRRVPADDGCTQCECYSDPCERTNCSASEKCVVSVYKDLISGDVQYTGQCVPVDCSAAEAVCAALSCPYGVQRTRARGCVQCACVTEEVDCRPLADECATLRCQFGVQRARGDNGCERCTCLANPCEATRCAAGERCVVSQQRAPLGGRAYSTQCRPVNKSGECPAEDVRSTESGCREACRDDADCIGVGKCCAWGCSRLCLKPAPAPAPAPLATSPPSIPEEPRGPEPSRETEPSVAAAEGGKASLRCIFHGNPPPKITWQRGEIIIDSDVDRYRLLSDGTLEIVSLHRNDSGVYICIGDNGLGRTQQEIHLQVTDPVETSAGIAGAEGALVLGAPGAALRVRCLVFGHPRPSVNWYRGASGPMVPLSSAQYEYEERGRTLLIRRLDADTLGEYTCLAYNGVGSPASWLVTVRAAPAPAPAAPRAPPASPPPPPDPTTLQFRVKVGAQLTPGATTIRLGEELSLPCEVEGYPEPQVSWTRDGARLVPDDRMWITNSRLVIPHTLESDSGLYGCHANNGYSSDESTVQIVVRGVYIPSKCTDSPYFANCALIVQSKFCTHKYYSRFCCKSCVEAGLLDPSDVEMQGDAPFRKK